MRQFCVSRIVFLIHPLKTQLFQLERERELERQREQEASEALIRQLEEEGKMKSVAQQLIEERDGELAKELENVVNEVCIHLHEAEIT